VYVWITTATKLDASDEICQQDAGRASTDYTTSIAPPQYCSRTLRDYEMVAE